jgi:hypothetical protein
MTRIPGIFIGVVLLAIAAFCAFGFVAAAEPPFNGNIGVRLLYAIPGLSCLLVGLFLLSRKTTS